MLKPSREDMIHKLENIYNASFTGGISLIKEVKKVKKIETEHHPEEKSLINWFPKDYMFYFANLYLKQFNITYNISFESDLKIVNQFIQYFKSLGVDFRFHTKSFIDWGFDNRIDIISKYKYFTIQTLKNYINEYTQMSILELNLEEQTQESYDFVSELNDMYDKSKMLAALKKFGIPIVATYLENHKNISQSKIISGIASLNLTEDDLIKVAKSSIIRSPYLVKMFLLDWRQEFEKLFKFCYHESWWRDVDYNGRAHISYGQLLE